MILMETIPNYLITLAAYNSWANERVLTNLEQLDGPVPASTLHLLSHIMNAEAVWISRIEGMESPVTPFDEHSLADCRDLFETTSDHLEKLACLEAAELAGTIAYTNFQGASFTSVVQDILLQVFNHGTYHRAQIAQDLRRHQLEPVNTDYITYVRMLGPQT